MVDRVLPLRGLPPEGVSERLREYLDELDAKGRFLLLKLVGGSFRVGVSRLTVTRALAAVSGVDAKLVAQRLIGYTGIDRRPDAASFHALIAPADGSGVAAANPDPWKRCVDAAG